MIIDNSIEQLKHFLKEMFQFNANDLDFGIYKIYNLKRKEIEGFIDGNGENCLEPVINKTLEKVNNVEKQVELTSLNAYLKKFNQESLVNDPIANFEKINQLIINFGDNDTDKESLSAALTASTKEFTITDELKDKIYNHILGYFEMYYSNGDFGYNNRSRNLYKVPYEADYDGSDTLFHWKHKGSLYIKTGASFNAIKFRLKHLDKDFELRLETNDDSQNEEVARNNNKDTKLKHYQFNRFEETGGITKIVFNLSDRSTTKADLFKTLFREVFKSDAQLDHYLFVEGKPVFNDLTDDYDKVQDGSVKGIGALRVNRKIILGKINKNFEKGAKIELIDTPTEHFSDDTLETIYNIDQKLNSLYIGNDSDYFIHENLQEFLTQEKERYIKNYILGDLKSILDGKLDNTTLIIAKAFDQVSSRIIEFLSTIEEFQKKLFTMKKKVVESEYCLTIDNLDEKFYPEILANAAQLTEWQNLFGLSIKTLSDLQSQPTLVLDTKFFKQPDDSNNFKDQILAEIEDLDEKTNGLLINSENYQALSFLEERYREKIQCIYIDPPYNTGSDEFQYKDNFKHSSWLSMIDNRIKLAKNLLNDKGALFTQIDYKEANNLRSCLTEIFEDRNFVQLISIKTASPAGFKTVNPGPIDVTEYLLFFTKNKSKYSFKKGFVPISYDSNYNLFIENISEDSDKWRLISIIEKFYEANSISNNADAKAKWGNDWKIIRDTLIGTFALQNKNLIVSKRDPHKPTDKLKELMRKSTTVDYVIVVERENEKPMYVYKGGVLSFYSNKIKHIDGIQAPTELLSDFWTDISWAGIANEGLVKLKNGKKPEKLIRRILEISSEPKDFIVDFFAGSGTTCAASHKMNRKWIGVEVGKYFDSILKQRLINVLYGEQTGISVGEKWKGGGILKYITLEQYEDVLDAITQYDGETPQNLPLKYLYKPELNKINSTLNLGKPFGNQINYGQPTKQGYVDLVDTYNYLQGYEVNNIRVYTIGNKYFKVVKTASFLIIWRDVVLGEDDSKAIITIVENYPEATAIEVNYDFNILATLKNRQLQVGSRLLDIKIITADAFNQ